MEQRSRKSKSSRPPKQPLTRDERFRRQLVKAEGFKNYQLQLLENLQSPALAKGGSDTLVFFSPGFPITETLWPYLLRKEEPWNHSDMRSFVSSCLIASSPGNPLAEEVVNKLASDKGIPKIRLICNSSVSVDAGLKEKSVSFQSVILPFIALLIRNGVRESTFERQVNAIYSAVYAYVDSFIQDQVLNCVDELIRRRSLRDTSVGEQELLKNNAFIPVTCAQIVLVLVRFTNEILGRIREAKFNLSIQVIGGRLEQANNAWKDLLTSGHIVGDILSDEAADKSAYCFTIIDKELDKMKRILNIGKQSLEKGEESIASGSANVSPCIDAKNIAMEIELQRDYDPPGELSKLGKRHDNDEINFQDIDVIPTPAEIFCKRSPFLPSSLPYAPHFLDAGPKKMLDIQFRLLREDMLRPLRDGLYNLVAGLIENEQQMTNIINKSGRFRYDKGKINGDLNVYSNVRFKNIKVDKRKGFLVQVGFKPPKAGKSKKQRKDYWDRSKKLLNGSLICVLWAPKLDGDKGIRNSTNGYTLYFGVITDRQPNSLANEYEATIGIHFMDTSIYPIVLEDINCTPDASSKTPDRFMVESTGVYFEAYVHILKALQDFNPGALPFSRHLAPVTKEDLSAGFEPPLYARAPGFKFDLSVLLGRNKHCMLDPTDELSQDRAIKSIIEADVLDRSQAEALVRSLCREIALIEGPPGTGKTYVGVKLMKVLLNSANRKRAAIGPVLIICFTNHALDQFLEHLLHAGIKQIVRLGGQSKSEEIKPFSLEEQCRNRRKTAEQSRMLAKAYKELDRLSTEAGRLAGQLSQKAITWDASISFAVSLFLLINYPSIYEQLREKHADTDNEQDADSDDEWEEVVNNRKRHEDRFSQWLHGSDLEQIKNSLRNREKGKQKQREPQLLSTHNQYEFLQDQMEGMQDQETKLFYEEDAINLVSAERIEDDGIRVWEQQDLEIPESDRPLEILLQEQNVWKMSMNERTKLHNHWKELIHKDVVQRLADLEITLAEKRKEINDIHDGVRKKILSTAHVIGMTTNGAAKFQTLIRSVAPRIIVCEEAGEVLEAHILAPLKETQHLILIGDHLQLRPHVTTYELSLDSNVGKKFALDRSMFERLVNDEKPMVQLLTQRRMRSEIADLVRKTLYPDLIDHECTAAYPRVRGTTHNLFFFDHKNPEDAAGSNLFVQSHSNSFEVKMVVAMVKYFVRNGYDKSGDIAVLTPYLGQMIQIRDALSQQFVVIIDERDGEQITRMTEDNESKEDASSSAPIPMVSRNLLTKQVTLRTIDNFQGEEATIVIISLVRNVNQANGSGTIGFLKSENRTNVLLSRAKHGMFLLGNADLLAERARRDNTTMWPTVIDILREKEQLGNAFPLRCNRHPDTLKFVERPEQFSEFAPDGGCQEPCGFTLKCGHVCQYKCHSDDPDHLGIKCGKPCQRLHEPCQHTCPNLCGDKCGNCEIMINNVELPCGHVKSKAPCYQARDPTAINCTELVDCILPRCGHEQKRHCFEAPKDIICKQKCGILLPCGHLCLSNCDNCQRMSILASPTGEALLDAEGHVIRSNHAPCTLICDRNLYCEHRCESKCHDGKPCPPCSNKCVIKCKHSACSKKCSEPCNVCAEPCDWQCDHQKKCLLSCGSPCIRLPCNKRCEKLLPCKHQCPGVCGEECVPVEFCPICAPPHIQRQMSDMAMLDEFDQVDWNLNRMIVLECNHAFTMSYLDKQLGMSKFYDGIDGEAAFEKIWIKICTLPNELGSIQRCPMCRHPITNIRRYGRPIKKAILDMQSKKFLLKYTNLLRSYTEKVRKAVDALDEKRNHFLKKFEQSFRAKNDEKRPELPKLPKNLEVQELTHLDEFVNLRKIYEIPRSHTNYWIIHNIDLIRIYGDLSILLAETKTPPWKATFGAAVSHLFRSRVNEMDCIIQATDKLNISDSDNMILSLQRESFHGVGMVFPVIDRKCYLEIFLVIVNVQKILFQEVDHVVQSLTDELTGDTRYCWIKFGLFILESTIYHLNSIIRVAKETKYYRQYVTATIELAEARCRFYRYTLQHKKMSDDVVEQERKNTIAQCKEIVDQFTVLINEIFPQLRADHFQTQCENRMENIVKEIEQVTNLARGGVLTKKEKIEIFQAMNEEFIGGGHWYTCPNGHTYTIDGCGRAMQTSRCPDCRETIGGSNHTLLATNRRDEEFESLRLY